MKKIGIAATVCTVFLLAACGSKDDDKEVKLESAEKLYNDGQTKFNAKEYKEAAKDFDEVDRQHPSSEWAPRAQIMSAYASYKASDYDTAVATLDHYVKLYPNNEATPYAYYMIALCYYEQISDVGRDQKITEKALQALREVLRRFPDTEYARDAKIKQDLTIDHLAGKEMEIGRYYLRHDDFLAAVNRFRYVVETYQTTTHVPEALHRLVECYLKMGVPDEAKRYAAVLGYNYPGSSWYKDSYKLMNSKVAHPDLVKPSDSPKPVEAPQPAPDKAKLTTPPEETGADKTEWWNFWSGSPEAKPSEQAKPVEQVKPDVKQNEPAKPVELSTDKPDLSKPQPESPNGGGAKTVPPIEVDTDSNTKHKEWWDFWSGGAEEKPTDKPEATPADKPKPDAPKPADEPPGDKTWYNWLTL